MGLIDDARLTDEEMEGLVHAPAYFMDAFPSANDPFSSHYEPPYLLPRVVADAATAKALWAIVEWLESQNDSDAFHTTQVCLPCMTFEISNLLEEAGIERPRETAR